MAGKVITIAQQKGGAGKTTVTCHLAIALAGKGYKVAAIDIDPQGSLTAWYDARYKYAGDAYKAIHCTAFEDWWRLSWEIESLREAYDIVLVDCPPHSKNDAKTAVREADMVVVPIQPSPTDLWATTKTVDLTNREHRNTYLLLNRVIPNSRLGRQFIRDLPRRRFETVFTNRIGFAAAMAEGRTITETEPSSSGAKEVWGVVEELEQMLQRITREQGEGVPETMREREEAFSADEEVESEETV